MMNTCTMRVQGSHVSGRTVALVSGKTVLREFVVHLDTPAVTVHLGQNGCRRDGWNQGVALDNGLGRQVEQRQAVAIDQHHGRLEPQAHHGPAHGQQRGLQDVEPIDLFGFHLSVKGLWDANPIALKSLEGVGADERRSHLHARFDIGATIYNKSGISADVSLGYEGLGGDGYSSKSVTGRLKIPLN